MTSAWMHTTLITNGNTFEFLNPFSMEKDKEVMP